MVRPDWYTVKGLRRFGSRCGCARMRGMTEPVPQRYLDFLAAARQGVLVTIKRDGRPQSSNVVYGYDAGTGRVRVSVTADRAKTRNATRDARVAVHVSS